MRGKITDSSENDSVSGKSAGGLWGARIGGLLEHRGSFTGDVLISLGGSGVARLITLASMPFITRLYGASDYGAWVIILTIAGLLLLLATLRYELAVVLAPTRRITCASRPAVGFRRSEMNSAVAGFLPARPVLQKNNKHA